ncbi:DNA/RNA nuclease SfsA [Bengtsoniella intestinalis]|uniref:DNA/RNA nuclease SfsA n=1 Tax=Bengtsoniella intestinalis TaxID=3073143 RepID=UPI00391F7C7C
MRYKQVISGTFIARPNRFIAHVETADGLQICHVKNTGRCRELLQTGVQVYLEQAQNPNRKTKYDLIAVEKGDLLINMDAQAPNTVFLEFAKTGKFLPDITAMKAEVTTGKSRIDACLDTAHGRHWVEVKGVTLEQDCIAAFPDAPTERGVRHIQHLQSLVEAGDSATIFFVVQMEGITAFRPNDSTHPAFGNALRTAKAAGVDIQAWGCHVTPDTLDVTYPIPIQL